MLKPLFTVLIFIITQTATAQKVIINGAEGNRPLQWNDFTGKVDKSSSFFAYTRWKSNFKFGSVQPKGDSVSIGGLEITIQLDPDNSWAKKDNVSDYLLLHEQGHFNIGLLYMKDLLQKLSGATFSRARYQQEMQAIINEAGKKYNDMSLQYDKETDHSKNKEEQARWNDIFGKQLP